MNFSLGDLLTAGGPEFTAEEEPALSGLASHALDTAVLQVTQAVEWARGGQSASIALPQPYQTSSCRRPDLLRQLSHATLQQQALQAASTATLLAINDSLDVLRSAQIDFATAAFQWHTQIQDGIDARLHALRLSLAKSTVSNAAMCSSYRATSRHTANGCCPKAGEVSRFAGAISSTKCLLMCISLAALAYVTRTVVLSSRVGTTQHGTVRHQVLKALSWIPVAPILVESTADGKSVRTAYTASNLYEMRNTGTTLDQAQHVLEQLEVFTDTSKETHTTLAQTVNNLLVGVRALNEAVQKIGAGTMVMPASNRKDLGPESLPTASGAYAAALAKSADAQDGNATASAKLPSQQEKPAGPTKQGSTSARSLLRSASDAARGATADKKQATTGPSDAKPKAGADAAPSPVTPQSLLLEVQAVHKSVKAMADGNQVAAGTKVSNEVEAVRKDITTVMKYLTASDKDVKDLTSRVCTLMTNLDIHAKSSESYLKEILKSLATIAGAAKTFHADTQVLIAAKHDNIADGVKACINKVTNTDFETHQSLTRTLNDLSKQTYDLGKNFWRRYTMCKVKVIRDYCERPVPVNVQGGPQANMPPPPAYEPSIHAARQQLHLQSAIPVARGGGGPVPQVNIDMGVVNRYLRAVSPLHKYSTFTIRHDVIVVEVSGCVISVQQCSFKKKLKLRRHKLDKGAATKLEEAMSMREAMGKDVEKDIFLLDEHLTASNKPSALISMKLDSLRKGYNIGHCIYSREPVQGNTGPGVDGVVDKKRHVRVLGYTDADLNSRFASNDGGKEELMDEATVRRLMAAEKSRVLGVPPKGEKKPSSNAPSSAKAPAGKKSASRKKSPSSSRSRSRSRKRRRRSSSSSSRSRSRRKRSRSSKAARKKRASSDSSSSRPKAKDKGKDKGREKDKKEKEKEKGKKDKEKPKETDRQKEKEKEREKDKKAKDKAKEKDKEKEK
ncbi:nipblb [Symbiodinium microadriaticum]|nr:nipblb [Symbiodinium microadriaticum]